MYAHTLARIRDPTKNEPRLLKLKDWPPGDDFSEKLPRRWASLRVSYNYVDMYAFLCVNQAHFSLA